MPEKNYSLQRTTRNPERHVVFKLLENSCSDTIDVPIIPEKNLNSITLPEPLISSFFMNAVVIKYFVCLY